MATTVGQLFVELKNDSARYKSDLVKTTTDAGKAGGQAASRSLAQSLGDGLKQHAKLIAATAGAALGTFVAGSAQKFASFEKGMNEVFTLLPGITAEAMSKMESDVKAFSNETGVLTDEVIPALYGALSAGIPQDNVFAFLETANMAAKAGVATTDQAVALLSQSVNAWGLEAEAGSKRVADAMFTTVRLGVTTFPQLAEHMNKVSGSAAVLGVDVEEVGAALAGLTKVGQPTEIAMTNLAATMTLLQKGTPELTRVLDHMGYESGQAALDALGLQGTLEMLRTGADELGIAIPAMTGRVQAANAIFGLTGQNAAAAQEVLGEFDDTAGAVDAAFEQMDQGVQAAADRIAARINTLMIGVGEAIAPVAPLLVAFGPTIGRALGAAFGAGFGLLVTYIPRLMAPVVAKIAGVMAASTFGQNILNGLSQPGFMGKLTGLGGSWGRILGAGAAIAMGAIIVKELGDLMALANQNREAGSDILSRTGAQALAKRGLSRAEAEAELENLRTMRDELDGVAGALDDISSLPIGSDIVSFAFGASPADVRNKAIADYEEYLATSLPDVAPQLHNRGNELGYSAATGVAEGVADGSTAVEAETKYLVESGIIAPVEDGADEATDIAAEMASVDIPDAINDGLNSLRAGSSIEDAFGALGDDAVAALTAHLVGGVDIETAFASLPEEMQAALEPLGPVIAKAMRVGNRVARHEAALMGPSIRDGIKQGRDSVDAAMADLRWALTHPLRNVKYIAEIESRLTGRRLARGLKSSNPDVRRQAEQTRSILIDEWEKATGESWDWGKSVSNNLAGGVRERRKNVRTASSTVANEVKLPMLRVANNATIWGQQTTANYASGIDDPRYVAAVRQAAQAATNPVSKNMKIASPAEEGPLSKLGGPEGWGRRLTESFAKGLGSLKLDPVAAMGLTAFDGIAAASRGATGGAAKQAPSGGGGVNVNLKTYGLPLRTKTPLEVVQQARRAARLGVMTPEHNPKWADS